jgi:acyl-CoA thioester hydrolase
VFVVGQDAPRAVGEFVHVYVDASTRKPTPIPQVVRAALAALPPAER